MDLVRTHAYSTAALMHLRFLSAVQLVLCSADDTVMLLSLALDNIDSAALPMHVFTFFREKVLYYYHINHYPKCTL